MYRSKYAPFSKTYIAAGVSPSTHFLDPFQSRITSPNISVYLLRLFLFNDGCLGFMHFISCTSGALSQHHNALPTASATLLSSTNAPPSCNGTSNSVSTHLNRQDKSTNHAYQFDPARRILSEDWQARHLSRQRSYQKGVEITLAVLRYEDRREVLPFQSFEASASFS